jgi:TIGR03009 family protein
MRPHGLVLAALLLACVPAGAQQPPAPAAAPAPSAEQALDTYLQRWEQEMQKIQTLWAQLERTDWEKTFDRKEKLVGAAQYMRTGTGASALNLATLELYPEGKKEVQEKYVCTGTFLYQFMPAQKEIHVYELPRPKPGQVADDSLLTLLFGMKAQEAKTRYSLKLVKEDQYYVYVDITPKLAEDRRDFTRARLVLNRDTFLPRQLWFEHGNGNEVTWDIPQLRTGIALNRANFDAPRAPEGWKLVPVQRNAQPQAPVVRPQNR